jgi:hypothetical protein
MTMPIKKEQIIAGYPAFQIRHLLRHIRIHDAVTSLFASQILNISKGKARKLSAELEALGYIQKAPASHASPGQKRDRRQWFEITDLGVSLALASAAPRIKRATADKLIAEFMCRVHEANANPDFTYSISAVVLFGSALGASVDLGDVDLAIQLTPRVPDFNQMQTLCRARIQLALDAGRVFRNITEEVCWPRNEIRMFLRDRKRSISIADLQSLQELANRNLLRYRVLLGSKDAVRAQLGDKSIED